MKRISEEQYREYLKLKNRKKRTYTKDKMDRIINVALIDIQFPFILAFMGRENIAETMGGLIVTEIVAVFLVYCLKSFFETNAQENIRLREKEMGSCTGATESEEVYENEDDYGVFG